MLIQPLFLLWRQIKTLVEGKIDGERGMLFGGGENIRRLVSDTKNNAGTGAEVGQADNAGRVEPKA